MRPPALRIHHDELVVDGFAGGGGASLGIEWALGRSPDIAINHDPEAVAMHAANHPATRHLCGNVWDVNPRGACGGRRVALLWLSPDCTFHSKARGGKPFRDPKSAKGRRGLAWVAVRWAREVRPRVIALENVEEFQDWGPLDDDGRPDPLRRGLTFRRWKGSLEAAGYRVEMRELRASDYGAPTIRKRLFVVARCDGEPIVWPVPTHGRGLRPHRAAAECISWELPCPSIFDRARPLAEKTLTRIARGVQRFVIDAAEGQAPRVRDIREPFPTVTAAGSQGAIVSAFLARHVSERATGGWAGGASLVAPAPTVTASGRNLGLVTVSAHGDRRDDVRAFLTKYYGKGTGQPVQLALGTVTTRDRFGLVLVRGEPYSIADIGMRLLAPRELFRAQGFPDSYVIDPIVDGAPLSKTAQIRMCGNSVPPAVAAAIVSANLAADVAAEVG